MDPPSKAEQNEITQRQMRSTRLLVILISIALILTLTLPIAIGIASYWLMGHYDVLSGMLRLFVSVSIGLVAVFLLQMVVVIPLTGIAATQSARLHAAFHGQRADDVQAQKLVQTLADQHDARGGTSSPDPNAQAPSDSAARDSTTDNSTAEDAPTPTTSASDSFLPPKA